MHRAYNVTDPKKIFSVIKILILKGGEFSEQFSVC